MDHNISGESSASSLYHSHENIRSIFADPFSSSGESALSPVSDHQRINLSQSSIVESFEELSTDDAFTSESGQHDESGRRVLSTSDFKHMVYNAERICVRTPAYRQAASLLRDQRSATISGSLKDGKTTMALALCHEFSQEGWNVCYHDFSNNTFGFLSASETDRNLYVFENLFCSPRVKYEIEKIMEKKKKKTDSAFLFTCMSFNLKGKSIKLNSDVFLEGQIVDLAWELKHCNFVKWKILRKHPSRLTTDQVSAVAQQSQTHTGFPGLCELFSDSSVTDPLRFFSYPHKHYQLLLRTLFQDKRKCCVFMILLLSGGQLYLKDLIENNDYVLFLKKLLQQLFPETRIENLRDELPLLYGVFLKESYHIVSFQYEVIYDAAVFVMDSMFPGFLWKHCTVEHVEDGDTGMTNSFTGKCRTIYLTRSNSNQIMNNLVQNVTQMQLKTILEHAVLRNNGDNVDLFIEKLESSVGNFIKYEDPTGGNFLFWCMKSSCVDMQRTVLNHRLLTNEDIFDCLAFHLTREGLKLSESSVDMVLTKLQVDSEGCGRIMQDLLLIAASVGDVKKMIYFSQHGASLTIPNNMGETCLHLASFHNRFTVANAIIDHFKFGSIDPKDKKGMTPAMVAEERGFSDITSQLVAKGADPSIKNEEGNALIHLTCLSGNVDLTRFLLLSKKQDADLPGQYGRTPVMMAALVGELEIVTLLEEYGCDISVRDRNGDNILHMSCLSGCLKVVDHILASGKVDINSTNSSGRSCLMIASLLGNETLFNVLVSTGCDLFLTDINKNTALHYAFFGKDVEYIKFLLSKKLFDVNAQGEQGRSPMMQAVTFGLTEIVDFLIPFTTKWNSCDTAGNNVLHEGCRTQRLCIVKKIISLGVLDINCRGCHGMTPVMFAARTGNIKMLDILITAGADTSLRDGDGNTILHLASAEGQTDMVCHIITRKLVDRSMKGFRSRSPLMMAVMGCHTATVEILLPESDLSVIDVDGHSPLVLACLSDTDNEVIVDMLIKAYKNLSDVNGQSQLVLSLLDRGTVMTQSLEEQFGLSTESVSVSGSDSFDQVIESDEWHTAFSSRDGWTPVMHAAKVNNLKIVQYLCRTIDIFKRNSSGDNAIHVACLSESMEVAEFLMTEYPKLVNMKGNEERTPLMIAVRKQNHRLFHHLINAGANPRLTDTSNDNILHIAALVGDVELVEMIVQKNLCEIESKGQFGRTALMIAARRKRDDVCDTLIRLECNIYCVDCVGNSILHVSRSVKVLQKLQRLFNIDTRNKLGQTPAMKAARRGHFETFRYLFDLGSNINIKSHNGYTVLHEASIGGNVGIVKTLIAQDDVDVNATESKGKTPVMFAAEKGHKDVFFALVRAGCDLQRKDNSEKTCYRYALKGANADIVRYIEKSQDIT